MSWVLFHYRRGHREHREILLNLFPFFFSVCSASSVVINFTTVFAEGREKRAYCYFSAALCHRRFSWTKGHFERWILFLTPHWSMGCFLFFYLFILFILLSLLFIVPIKKKAVLFWTAFLFLLLVYLRMVNFLLIFPVAYSNV